MGQDGWVSGDPCWCAELPDTLPRIVITDDMRLASLVTEVSVTPGLATYRCPACGQMWEDRYLDRAGLFKI